MSMLKAHSSAKQPCAAEAHTLHRTFKGRLSGCTVEAASHRRTLEAPWGACLKHECLRDLGLPTKLCSTRVKSRQAWLELY